MSKRNMRTECYQCKNRQPVPGDAHIACIKPDRNMVGNEHGIRRGWFYYPVCFDPCWKERLCANFEQKEG